MKKLLLLLFAILLSICGSSSNSYQSNSNAEVLAFIGAVLEGAASAYSYTPTYSTYTPTYSTYTPTYSNSSSSYSNNSSSGPGVCGKCKGYSGVGGPCYTGVGGGAYAGVGGAAYAGVGGPCYEGVGGPCYSGVGGGWNCPAVCSLK